MVLTNSLIGVVILMHMAYKVSPVRSVCFLCTLNEFFGRMRFNFYRLFKIIMNSFSSRACHWKVAWKAEQSP